MKNLVLVDGNALMFRVYYATINANNYIMKNRKGVYTNALLGFINILEKIIAKSKDYIFIAFDAHHLTKRHAIYADYKKGRPPTPLTLISQIPLIKQYLELSGIKHYEQIGYEADDIIGTLAKKASKKNIKVEIFSSDKDLLQLVDENITVCLMKKGISQVEYYNPTSLLSKYGLNECQMIDFKSMVGDSSDNIKGVLGIGPKTATKLLQKFSNLENIFSSLNIIKPSIKDKLILFKEKVFFNRLLLTIDLSVPLPFGLLDTKIKDVDLKELIAFYKEMNLEILIFKLQKNKTYFR
ncbi:DNA polymerase I (3'-5' exonuclease and polymerase domain [Candidatus Phytoplasma mali]|uniref:5'-3' exonuclease n=1 Tax=Phytoplasma mali (strain AT) TaxID=482235 RepID=B3R095_PHYMT|nr:5'-3' exonuclease [Candidatus Phytoplasma mali]CAP18259.1 DNA polymerase I (3'-5' exonuclease and polymerase domain [Candidatus Phytoplasma mali]